MSVAQLGPSDTELLVQRAVTGDRAARNELFSRYTQRLLLMARYRLDPALKGLVDPWDIVQKSYLVAARRLEEYSNKRPGPFFLWLRRLVHERILHEHRYHLRTQKRNRRLELHGTPGGRVPPSSAAISRNLVAKGSSPEQKAARKDLRELLEKVLSELEDFDREILVLRHFEQLSTAEAALELDISEDAVKKRHVRALQRFRQKLEQLPGGLSGLL